MTVETTDWKSLRRVLGVQTQVAFNDNAAKLMLVLLAISPGVLPEGWAVPVVGALSVLLIFPFIAVSPVAGWLADRFSKRTVLQAGLGMQAGVMALLAGSLYFRSMTAAMACFGLLAVQSALFSPAKRGILKELAGTGRLSLAVGWMEMLTITAILVGSLCGALFFDLFSRASGGPWDGAFLVASLLLGASLLAWAAFQGVASTPAQSAEPYRARIWWRHFVHLGELWRERSLFRAGLGGTFFFSLGGLLYLTLVQIADGAYRGENGTGSFTALMLGFLGCGAVSGHLAAGVLSRGRVELGLVPIGCLGIAAGLGVLAASTPGSMFFLAALAGLGFAGGLFLVPLYAFLQDRAGDHRRGRILAAVNIMESIGGIAAAGLYVLMARVLELTPGQQMVVMMALTLIVGLYIVRLLPDHFAVGIVRVLAWPLYRFQVRGLENLPGKGGAVVIANHASHLDAVFLQLVSPRRLHFLAASSLERHGWLRWVFRLFSVIPVSPQRAREALKTAAERAANGEIVCIFPEGAVTRTGTLLELKEGFTRLARRSGAPVVPVYLDRAWGSLFSFRGGRFLRKFPRRLPYSVSVSIGEAIPAQEATVDRARKALYDLGEAAFRTRPELGRHLGRECVRALSRRPWRTALVDHSQARRELARGKLLAASVVLSRRIRRTFPERRVGIVLPPGIGGAIANLAVVLAGKIPVNLNFTAGREALAASLEKADVSTVLTADAMKARLRDFPWPEKTIDLGRLLKDCGRLRIFGWLVAVLALPPAVVSRILDLPRHGGDAEAGLLFTSGSSGVPKGVPLTHRNILGNVEQIDDMEVITSGDTLLASLPLFHSFGFTVTLWSALLKGVRVASVPSPLDARGIASVIAEERATVHVGTPTFLRSLMKQASPEQLRSLRMVVCGAEKLPDELSGAFLKKFGVPVLQGYGLTETTPVAAVNVPDPEQPPLSTADHRGQKPGSVGRLVPGMSARILCPDTESELLLGEKGILCLRGANVFSGYLDDEIGTRECFRGAWFVTGDLARIDSDGFLFIEGRLSRFSKIGGEMIPHGRVEEKVAEALGLDPSGPPAAVVTAVPDEEKGEALVLLTTAAVEPDTLRRRLADAGLPNLWLPRIVRTVEEIPLLGSGKLDLKTCRRLAEETPAAV